MIFINYDKPKLSNINKISLKTVNQMANDYRKIYKSHMK